MQDQREQLELQAKQEQQAHKVLEAFKDLMELQVQREQQVFRVQKALAVPRVGMARQGNVD